MIKSIVYNFLYCDGGKECPRHGAPHQRSWGGIAESELLAAARESGWQCLTEGADIKHYCRDCYERVAREAFESK